MGLVENTGSSRIKYVYLFDGNMCLKTSESDEKARRRVNKLNKVVYEKVYQGIKGVIKDIFIRDSDFGKELCLLFEDNDEYFQLKLLLNSKQARTIIYRLPNLNFKHKVQITAFLGEDNYTAVAMLQDGDKVKSHFTKEQPNGLPPLKEVVINGEKKYDGTQRNEFLCLMIKNYVHPQLGVTELFRNRNQILEYIAPGTEEAEAPVEKQEFIPPPTKAQNTYPDYYDQSGEYEDSQY